MKVGALLFDFDGVLIESEAVSNRQIAEWLTAAGFPTSVEESMGRFMGLARADFHAAVERWVGGPLPAGFEEARVAANQRLLAEGVPAVAGAVAFVEALPPGLPRAVVSSSSTMWIGRHLDHLGLRAAFGDHLYSGREHVKHGKPAPDLYLFAAEQLHVPIERCAIVEDSPVGVTGAAASGAYVIGLTAGQHCGPDHARKLRELGAQAIAASFDEVAALIA
jgi:HAD superfamily hydrolase (TIGR01509 family)